MTISSTMEGAATVRPRHKKVIQDGVFVTVAYSKSVKRPMMIQQFFDAFSAVDVHDHLRQGSIAMEKDWSTRTWWHRLFATLFSVCVVDAFLAYRFENLKNGWVPTDLTSFIGRLAYQLIHNRISDNIMVLRADQSMVRHQLVNFLKISDLCCAS